MVHRTPFFLPLLYPSLIWRIPSHRKELFLTFDDGPVSGPTDFVLETLTRLKAKATFFCIGDNIRKYPEVFRKVAAHGHVVGNHTFNHLNGWRTNTCKYLENMRKCHEEIRTHLFGEEAQDLSTYLFRPPYGRITRDQISSLSGCKIIMWDVLSVDYNSNLPAERCLRNTIGATRNGSVIVFHDSFKAEKNLMYALPRFVEHFSSLGFEFKVISV
jgi:peptidoglycan/xylan/chitin deacetylase (PgdA/CDA1 family)